MNNKIWVDLSCLLVEDDTIQAQLALSVLESSGFKTVWKKTGAEAVEAYRTQLFDLVVVDLQLPDMTGHDVIGVIASHTGNMAMIVALTSTQDNIELEKSLAVGAHDVYQKHVGAHVLRAKFRRLALEMVEDRRGKRQVEDIEQRLNDTIATLNTCAADRAQEIDDLRGMFEKHLLAPPLLSEEQIEAIAERAAEKAVQRASENAADLALQIMEKNMQLKIGRFVLTNGAMVVGAFVIGLVSWMAGKGFIKI